MTAGKSSSANILTGLDNGSERPIVIVTRKLPDVVETRLRELFDARLNLDDKPFSREELIEAVKTANVLVPTVTDRIDRGVLSQAGPRSQADRPVRHRRRQYRPRDGAQPQHHRHQYAGRAHRGHRRHDHGADPRRAAAAHRRRRRAQERRRRVAGLVADLDARPPHLRQAARHRRHGAHRPGGGQAGQGLRPADPLSQPQARRAGDREGARGDLLGQPRPDARPHGHHLDQLPAYAGDLSPALGAAARADEAVAPISSTRRAAR